ncbi:unnamed protein product [Sympodiomycopsis kandeliae]
MVIYTIGNDCIAICSWAHFLPQATKRNHCKGKAQLPLYECHQRSVELEPILQGYVLILTHELRQILKAPQILKPKEADTSVDSEESAVSTADDQQAYPNYEP